MKQDNVDFKKNNTRIKKKKRLRRKFIAVDVWKSEFGPTSVRAIFDVYSNLFKIELHNMKNHSFSKCVNALRKNEDPTYIAPMNSDSY